jgi:hypothetical protein
MAKYQIISPDGFTIENKEFYKSKKEALECYERWIEQYKTQGYYSSNLYGRIYWWDVHKYCEFKKYKKTNTQPCQKQHTTTK